MKTVYTLVALICALTIVSCKKDTISHASDFANSQLKWMAFKDSSHNSYRYSVTSGSWTGYGTETIITVRDGKVVGRSFVAKQSRHNGTTIVTTVLQEWTETAVQLSSHDFGYEPVTMDVIYERAKNDWLQKRDKASIYFEARNNGMISLAGYVPDGCQDDCLRGITIGSIEAI
jgi:hypothetical protein